MKCPNCGAELTGDVCEYCGSHFEKKQAYGCPRCGSKKIRYTRDWQSGNMLDSLGTCRDCGYSWPAGNLSGIDLKPTLFLWICGWMFCWPVPATVLLWRSKTVPEKVKYAAIGLLWFIYLFVFIFPWVSIWWF